ncbi:MAG TPA: BTAD domain-containing putative transcriptional regulator [Longimicrobiales bacterium]|nr:BTAD domain-containing putative transcriptional regulator [Longimicrobiales bacterium]
MAYLVVARPGPLHRRDSLLAMFWPELGADRGRNALSKVIHHLRKALPPGAILTPGDQIGIAAEALWCDVTEFERALESGRAEDALAVYRGDLLQGFHVPGSHDFDHWSEVERGRLRRMAVSSAWELAEDAAQAGDGVQATKFARQAVEWAPRDESGIRRLLTLLHIRGNRAEALEAFESFARKLRVDYAVDPSGPTRELVEAIRDGSLSSAPEPALTVASSPKPPGHSTESLEASPTVTSPELEPSTETSIGASVPPLRDTPHRRRVSAALAFGLVGLIALSLSQSGPSSVGAGGSPGGRVLVTEFDDPAGEGLGAAVSEALRVDLAQSRDLQLVDRADLIETLEFMGLARGTSISAAVGREVAVRDGLEALVEGAVTPAGNGYILTAAIRGSVEGRTIASFRKSVSEPDQMIAAIDELSLRIRDALGESLSTIQASLPLERVTTPSLEALTFYTSAKRVFDQLDDRSEAASLLQRAVALDPGFAMAWRMLAVAVQNDPDPSLQLEALRQAYRHRDRLSEVERSLVEASYQGIVARDDHRAIEALLRVLALDPDHPAAVNNLGLRYLYIGEVELAAEAFGRAVRTSRASSTAYANLIRTRIYLDQVEEASHVLREFEREYPDHELLPLLSVQISLQSGELDEADREARRLADDRLQPPARRANAWALVSRIAYWRGRLDEGRDALLRAERLDARVDQPTHRARVIETAHTEALLGDAQWARYHIESGLALGALEEETIRRQHMVPLTETLILTAVPGARSLDDDLASASRFSRLHARIQVADTIGVRDLIEELPIHLFQRVLLFDRLGDTWQAISLYERVDAPGYTGWGSTPERVHALMRLGPLYERAGELASAIEAYRRLSARWQDGDARGRAAAERAESRARALEAETRVTAR